MSLLEELEEENKKSGLFSNPDDVILSYPLGFPILDQQLGAIYRFNTIDGGVYETKQLGVQAGTITMVVGPSNSGKSTMAEQAAWNIIEPFGEDASIIHIDGEKSANPFRIRAVTGAEEDRFKKCYKIFKDVDTWEQIMAQLVAIGKKKASDPKRFMYNTGLLDVEGKEIEYYIPTVMIIDSLMSITSENESVDEISGLTSGGREAIYRGKWFRNALKYTLKYNINIFIINHYDDEMPQIGRSAPKGKELQYIPTGKLIPGGKKSKYYTNAIILVQPSGSKDDRRTVEINGYDGLPVKTLVIKSRTSAGGLVGMQEFIQEGGFDQTLTLMNLAKEKEVIAGRNPNCYFSCNPDVKFDTRQFMIEISKNPEIIRTLYQEMKPILNGMVRVIDTTDESNVITGKKVKQTNRQLMRELLY